MVAHQINNQVDLWHSCVCDSLTWDTKDILWMDDYVLILTYKYLAMGFPKYHILNIAWNPWRRLFGQDGIILSWYLKKLIQGMIYNEILGQGNQNIRRVLDGFLHALALTWAIG